MSVRNVVKSIQDIMRQDSGVDGDAQRISQLCWMFFLKIIDDQDQEFEVTQSGYKSPIPRKFQWRSWAADPEGITGEALLAFINDELFPGLKALSVAGQGSNRRRVVRDVFEDAYNYMKSGQLMRQVVNKITEVDFNDLAERQHFGDIYEQILNDLQSAGNAGEYYTPRAVTAFMVDRIDPKPGETLLDPACGTGGFLTCALRHMRDRYVKRPADEARMQAAFQAVEKKQLPHMLCVTNMLLHGVEDPSFVRHDNTLARPYISYSQSDRVDIVLTNPPFGGREEDGVESNFPQHFRTRETADLFLALIIRLLKSGGRAAVVVPDGTLSGEGVKSRLKEHLLAECNLHTIVRLPNSVFKPYANISTNILFFEKGEPTKDIWFYEHRVPEGQKAYSMTRPVRFEYMQGCIDWWGGTKRKNRKETEVAWKVSIEDVKRRGYNLDIKNPHTIAEDHGDPTEWLVALSKFDQEAAALRDKFKGILSGALQGLNANLLLSHFDKVGSTTDAIPSLRRFILDLAVRGRLVPQDSKEEPASALLSRIKLKIGRSSTTARGNTADHQENFELPSGWVWTDLGTICSKTGSGSTPRGGKEVYLSSGVIFLRSQNVYDDGLRLDDVAYIDPSTHSKMAGTAVRAGDLLLNITGGSIGRCCLVPPSFKEGNVSQHVAIIRVAADEIQNFLHCVIRSPYFQEHVLGQQTGAGRGGLPKNRMDRIRLALPPVAEQKRIVQRANELILLSDQLEASLAAVEDARRGLLKALLNEALPPAAHHDEAA